MAMTVQLLNPVVRRRRLTKSEFAGWQHQAVWDQLQGIPLGQSFCRHFGIQDWFLDSFGDGWGDPWLLNHIQRTYCRRSHRD